jgi:hypothetical protein
MSARGRPPLHFVLGEFTTPEAMLEGARRLGAAGFRHVDTHSPYPVEGVEEALALQRTPIAPITLLGAIVGTLTGYLLQWWCNGVDYPINVGGRPPQSPASWWLPSNIPITFELAVLFGSLSAFLGVFVLSGLPRPHHPAFELEAFRNASVDRFWVSVATAPDEIPRATAELESAAAARVVAVTESEAAAGRQEGAGQ